MKRPTVLGFKCKVHQKQPHGYPRFCEGLDQVDPLRRITFSKYRVLIKALKKSSPNVNLDLDNRLRIIMARWLKLTYNTVPLGIPDPHRTIHSDASGSGIGFMINSAKYQMTLDKSMEH